LLSQLFEQNIPQVVQCLSELDRVHQRMAVDVGFVMNVELVAAEMKGGDLAAVGFEPDFA